MRAVMLSVLIGAATGCGPCQQTGPTSKSAQPQWLLDFQQDRDDWHERINYQGGVFNRSELVWTQRSYIQPQMHPYDRYFYDETSGNYTVQRYLDDVKDRYGGIDSMLMWPTYTNIGIDDRNQFDFFRTMPGGLDAVARVTEELHAHGVSVLWPYNPWDTGTRREKYPDNETFAMLLKQTGGNGINGDTMEFLPESFWDWAVTKSYPIAFEAEDGGTDESLNWSTMGW